jgi:hypothetical protein
LRAGKLAGTWRLIMGEGYFFWRQGTRMKHGNFLAA